MKILLTNLELFLRLAALAQLGVAVLNLFLVRIMKWERDLVSAPLLIREVFQIHIYFISITLAIFGALTWRFAAEIATAAQPICVWLAIGIGAFWAVRSVMQWSHYSAVHWRGDSSPHRDPLDVVSWVTALSRRSTSPQPVGLCIENEKGCHSLPALVRRGLVLRRPRSKTAFRPPGPGRARPALRHLFWNAGVFPAVVRRGAGRVRDLVAGWFRATPGRGDRNHWACGSSSCSWRWRTRRC